MSPEIQSRLQSLIEDAAAEVLANDRDTMQRQLAAPGGGGAPRHWWPVMSAPLPPPGPEHPVMILSRSGAIGRLRWSNGDPSGTDAHMGWPRWGSCWFAPGWHRECTR